MDLGTYGPDSIATCEDKRGQGVNACAPPLDPVVLTDLGYFQKDLVHLFTK
jgi:hypothetical protein